MDAVLGQAAAAFVDVAGGTADPLLDTVIGLRTILLAAGHVGPASAETVTRLSAAMIAAESILVEALAPSIDESRVIIGVSTAVGLARLMAGIGEEEAAATLDRIDLVALLADNIDAAFRRRSIAARGDILFRSVAVRRAMEVGMADATFH
jgi:hypothetical protein